MCEHGRVVHHIKHAVTDERNTILIIGFQGRHTLGRQLVKRRDTVRIFGQPYTRRCHVETISGLSAHGDAEDLRWWFQRLRDAGGARQAFIVHGEEGPAEALSELIADCCDERPVIPRWGDSFEV
jgi:metallo-beta-lactamase family protein